MHYTASTLDDLLRKVYEKVMKAPMTSATRGNFQELIGVLLTLKNPRARLSRTESRGKAISPLGELCWYLAKSNESKFIEYYAQRYADDAEEDGTIRGAYGPRLYDKNGIDQVANAIKALTDRPSTRRCVLQIFDASDATEHFKEVPCTCTLQLLVRKGKLHLLVNMRSNDAFYGLVHDVFAFTMLQELMARKLGLELGDYKHFVGSLHLYDNVKEQATRYLQEGWQDGEAMPSMPKGDQGESIAELLRIERHLRAGDSVSEATISVLPEYWRDLARLLQVYATVKKYETLTENDTGAGRSALREISTLRKNIISPFYRPYVDRHKGVHKIAKAARDFQTELF